MKDKDCKNGHNSRCGFSKVEKGWNRAKTIRLANKAMKERMEYPSSKQRMSHYLQTCNIPQITDDFIEYKRAKGKTETKACALGALHIGADGNIFDNATDWRALSYKFDVKSVELDRFVRCPGNNEFSDHSRCVRDASIAEIMYHLNDYHEWTNFAIGLWMEKYQL